MIRCLQINLQRNSTTQNLLQQTSAATGAQILIVSEQNWNPTHDDRWVASTEGTCAVALTATADFAPDSIGAGRGFAWIQSRGIRIYSCYISRNDTDANFATSWETSSSPFARQTCTARLSSEATLMPGRRSGAQRVTMLEGTN